MKGKNKLRPQRSSPNRAPRPLSTGQLPMSGGQTEMSEGQHQQPSKQPWWAVDRD